VTRVVKVVPKVELRKVPHAPAFLTGLLGFRGKVVPVLDLGLLLGVTACQDRLSSRIILVNDTPGDDHSRRHGSDSSYDKTAGVRKSGKPDPDLLGLVAEHVSDLIYVRPEQITPAPVLLPQTPYLGVMIQTAQGIVQLLVVEQVRVALGASRPDQDATLGLNSEPSPLIG
jgi:chemotaxis-related protein WspB